MTTKQFHNQIGNAAGFSLIELLIAMAITVVLVGATTTLLMQGLRIRMRENQRSDGLADAQRALNLMTREIANSGFGLTDNGLVPMAADTNATSIHFRNNIVNSGPGAFTTTDADEDVTFVYQGSPNFAIVRYDKNTDTATDLGSRIDSLQFTYYDANGNVLDVAGTPSLAANAVRIGITLSVTLQASSGMPASQVQLTSDVMLRNAQTILTLY